MKRLFCPYCGKYTAITSKGLFVRHGNKRSKQYSWSGFDLNRFIEDKPPCGMSGKKYDFIRC